MRVLVTGAAGFVGRHVVSALRERELEVVTADHRWSRAEQLHATIGQSPVDRCIHLGWYARPQNYVFSVPGNAESLCSCLQLAEVLISRGCQQLVVSGTCLEYAPHEASRRWEDDLVAPATVYGSAKALCHEMLKTGTWPGRLAWARLFNVVGPGEHPERIVPRVTRALLAGRRIGLTAGHQVRDYIDVRDVATALVELAVQNRTGTFNVCRGEPVKLRAVFEGLAQRIGNRGLLKFGDVKLSPSEPKHLVGASERIQQVVGSSPRDLETILDDVVGYWRRMVSVEA